MKSYQWCDFEFDSDMFPDAGGYMQRLKDRGLRISVWINPYVGQASPLFEEGKKNEYFIKVRIDAYNQQSPQIKNLIHATLYSGPTAPCGNGISGKREWPSSTSRIPPPAPGTADTWND